MENLKYAQDLIKTHNSSVSSGFNMFINGLERPIPNEYSDYWERIQGYEFAEKMAKENGIAFIHKFKCRCGHWPFQYGGFWVCSSCDTQHAEEDWWKIKVEKDGDMFCCHGLDFINLQESNNYAFGKTFDESIENYEKVMRNIN